MTDKQIIVDEINKTIEQEMENLRNIAKKQIGKLEVKLKAKEQECEELKEDRERWKSNFNGKVSAIEELLKQLDQLKKLMKNYRKRMRI